MANDLYSRNIFPRDIEVRPEAAGATDSFPIDLEDTQAGGSDGCHTNERDEDAFEQS